MMNDEKGVAPASGQESAQQTKGTPVQQSGDSNPSPNGLDKDEGRMNNGETGGGLAANVAPGN